MNRKSFESKPSRLSVGKFSPKKILLAVIAAAVVIGGCLSAKIVDSRKAFYAGNPSGAAELLSKTKDQKGKDQILALLDYGMARHVAGNYRESAAALLAANKIIENNSNMIKLAETAGSMVTNEMMTVFRPESFERVLVHAYLMMDFMLMDEWEDARVEAKQTLKILDGLDPELQDQSFARFVAGLAFEVMGDADDAYIEYSRVAKDSPGVLQNYYDLRRLALQKGSNQDADKWAEKIKSLGATASDEIKNPNLIIFVGAGRSPVKKEISIIAPPGLRFSVPDYTSSGSAAHHARLKINGNYVGSSFVLTDLNPLAQKTLKKRIAKEIAKETARVAAKEAIVQQIENQDALLGFAARIVVMASENADTRSWETLPRYLGAIEQYLPPGTYDLTVEFYSASDNPLGRINQNGVTVTEGRRTVLSARSIN